MQLYFSYKLLANQTYCFNIARLVVNEEKLNSLKDNL